MQINPLDYEKLVLYWCHKCKASLPVEDSEEYGDGWIGLINACKLYDPQRVSDKTGKSIRFHTYASDAIKHAIWKRQNLRKAAKRGGGGCRGKRHKIVGIWSINHVCNDESKKIARNDDFQPSDYRTPLIAPIEDREQCDYLLSVLSGRFQQIVRDCLMESKSVYEVAKREGVSHTRIIQILNRSLFLMRKASVGLVGASE